MSVLSGFSDGNGFGAGHGPDFKRGIVHWPAPWQPGLVASPDSVGIDDALPIYPEQQIEVIQRVREMIKTMPVQDKRLDGNPDLGTKLQAK